MALTINHNPMAMNTARSLNQHFGRVSTSTQRLSSGLRINSSADDAAGLAIRELQRSDIRTLRQGARNANDAISMLQTMDGGLSIIDEKLIRMRELAEQAATGTYDSTQRMMINDEFQAMKSEIDRIAKSTDFNNIKLLCPDFANKIFINEAVELDSYLGRNNNFMNLNMPIIPETIVVNPNAITAPLEKLQFNRMTKVDSSSGDNNINNWYGYGDAVGSYDVKYTSATNSWSLLSGNGIGEPFEFYDIIGSNDSVTIHGYTDATKTTKIARNYFSAPWYGELPSTEKLLTQDTAASINWFAPDPTDQWLLVSGAEDYPDAKVVSWFQPPPDAAGTAVTTVNIDLNGDGAIDIIQTFTQNADGMGNNGERVDLMRLNFKTNEPVTKIHFGTGNESAEDYYYIDTKDCTARGLGIDKAVIDTQDAAQKNLTTLNSAIVKKDNARAYFGSMQNRLENTISNLNIQAENLQTSESRISDTDVGIEMTEMVKNQILSQSATAMLAQANSLPKMALQLMGG